jgi:hypothetical protein
VEERLHFGNVGDRNSIPVYLAKATRKKPMQQITGTDASPVTDAFIDALATVQTRVVDAIAGFRTMLKHCEPEIEEIVRDYLDTHERHDRQLSARLAALGKEPDADGSFFSTVQKAVVGVRAMFDFVDADVLPQVINGEERILSHYRDASFAAGIEADRNMLETQIAELERLNARARGAAQRGSEG